MWLPRGVLFLAGMAVFLPSVALSDDAMKPPPGMLDLTRAVVVIPPTLSGPEKKAVSLLVEDVTRRAGVKWQVTSRWPGEKAAVVAVGPVKAAEAFTGPFAKSIGDASRPLKPEGFHIRTEADGPAVLVAGNDPRGVLFGVGRLLRELRTTEGRVLVPAGFNVTTSPVYPLRGHQLGYRPKTNSYDAWDLARWERYIRDLAIFGTNAVELIPPRSDDDADSPHFPLPADRDDGRHVAAARRLRPGRLDLVSGDGSRTIPTRRPWPRPSRSGTRSSASCPGSTPSSSPAAIPATRRLAS